MGHTAEKDAGLTVLARYRLGAVTWCLRSRVARDQQSCGVCAGSGRIELVDASGQPIEVDRWSSRSHCPECNGKGSLWLDTEHHDAVISRLTIGLVATETTIGQVSKVSYMAEETGVGSGSVYRESELHPSRDAAIDAFFAAHPTGVLKSVDGERYTRVTPPAEGERLVSDNTESDAAHRLAENVRAVLKLLTPEHITPLGKRQIERVLVEHTRPNPPGGDYA